MTQEDTSEFVEHTACESCGSSDANAVYTDGHSYCFSCGGHSKSDGSSSPAPSASSKAAGLAPVGRPQALPKRKLKEETCQKFSYTVTEYNGQTVQVANYKRNGKVVAQKVRFANKDFRFLGDTKAAGLYGEHLWKNGGKKLVITEGEIDALSVAQSQGLKWPVVSLPNGAQGAARAVKNSLEFVCSFDTVVLMFDMDEPGQKAAQEIADLLPPSKAYIAQLPLKDASDMVMAGRTAELTDAIWQAKPYRPDGIINADALWEEVIAVDDTDSTPYVWDGLNEKTRGLRKGELVTFTAGSGIGKSSVVREIAYDLLEKGKTVGMMMLEENTKRTALGMMGIAMDKPLHLDREGVDEKDMRAAFDATAGSGRLWLYDHFGSVESDNLLSRLRYLATGCECDYIILDHISIAISGLADVDERRCIDILMTRLRSLVEETGVGLLVISHLRRPEGRGHEEGAVTSLSQLRGSHAIAQLSDMVLGLERNQQDAEQANVTTIRVLKNRFSGETGEAVCLLYDKETGRIHEHDMELIDGFTATADAEY